MNFFKNDKNNKNGKQKEKRPMKIPKFLSSEPYEPDVYTLDENKTFVSTGKKGEEIDLVSGNVYKKSEPIKPTEKKEGKDGASNLFEKSKTYVQTIPVKPKPKVIYVQMLIMCIELSYPDDKIMNFIKAYKEKEKCKFIKLVFFNNGIYQTDIKISYDLTDEEIMLFIKEKKELSKIMEVELKNSNLLFFDAVDETLTLAKTDIKITLNNYDYIVDELKFVFLVTGYEKGSKITKKELKSLLMQIRMKNSNLHLILTKYEENLLNLCTFGFRTIITADFN